MAVVPTFSPRIDLAGAYLGGERIRLGRDQLAQEAAADSARIALGREQLRQEAIANEMQLAAKKDLLSREALQKAQEAEIEKSYKETQFGLARRNLEQEELSLKSKLLEASRAFEAEQNYNRVRSELIAQRVPEREASEQAMRQVGFGAPGFSASIGGREQSDIPALKFQLSQLADQEQSIMNRYPGALAMTIGPEEQAQLQDIQRRRNSLQVPSILQRPQSGTGTNSTQRVRRYNRSTGKFE
jgi:hypothetical protein